MRHDLSILMAIVMLSGCVGEDPLSESSQTSLLTDHETPPGLDRDASEFMTGEQGDPQAQLNAGAIDFAQLEPIDIWGCTDAWRGDDPNGNVEGDGNLGENYMLTGVGARIDDDNVTTLHIRGQAITADGALGDEVTYKFGSEPNHKLEAWYEVPTGYGIVGIGMRADDDNLKTMGIVYRKYDYATYGFVGPGFVKRFGSDPNGPIEASFGTWEEASSNLEASKLIITGVGLRSNDDNIKTMRVRYCTIGY